MLSDIKQIPKSSQNSKHLLCLLIPRTRHRKQHNILSSNIDQVKLDFLHPVLQHLEHENPSQVIEKKQKNEDSM